MLDSTSGSPIVVVVTTPPEVLACMPKILGPTFQGFNSSSCCMIFLK